MHPCNSNRLGGTVQSSANNKHGTVALPGRHQVTTGNHAHWCCMALSCTGEAGCAPLHRKQLLHHPAAPAAHPRPSEGRPAARCCAKAAQCSLWLFQSSFWHSRELRKMRDGAAAVGIGTAQHMPAHRAAPLIPSRATSTSARQALGTICQPVQLTSI